MRPEQVADGLDRDVGGRSQNDTATAFWARRSLVSDKRRAPVNRQMTMTLAKPSITDPRAQPTRLTLSARTPAYRPRTPSAVIHNSDRTDSHSPFRTTGPWACTPDPVPQASPHTSPAAD